MPKRILQRLNNLGYRVNNLIFRIEPSLHLFPQLLQTALKLIIRLVMELYHYKSITYLH